MNPPDHLLRLEAPFYDAGALHGERLAEDLSLESWNSDAVAAAVNRALRLTVEARFDGSFP